MANADMCEHDWPGSGCPECFPRERRVATHPALGMPYGSGSPAEASESSPGHGQVAAGVAAQPEASAQPLRVSITVARSDGFSIAQTRLLSEINRSYFPESTMCLLFERVLREFENNGGYDEKGS